MTVTKNLNGTTANVALEGRLDTMTAPDLDTAIKELIPAADLIVMDISKLEYCSSAGLRVLLSTHKAMMNKRGKLTIVNANEIVTQVFSATGLDEVLNIE